jgi:antitoxin (DNA-binding transcriptional repressor) of toxin-antitoxin stability system
MKQVKAVGVKELKNNLSAHLREVQAGDVVLVSDRSRVVAELRQPSASATLPPAEAQVEEWVREGKMAGPSALKEPLAQSPVSLPAGASRRLLDLDRGES